MQVNSVTQMSTVASLPGTPQLHDEQLQAPFAGLFQDAVNQVQALDDKAATAVQGMLDGSGADIHTAMIATSDADAAFELSLAVRNKGVAAFQQMMNMQF